MSKSPATYAQKLVHGLIHIVPGAHEENLRTVRKVREFIRDPEASSPDLVEVVQSSIPATLDGMPFFQHPCPAWVSFVPGEYVTQTRPTPGISPAYLLPLPGQCALVLGSPDEVNLDGGIWDDKAKRWTNVKDLRILVNTPEGVTCATVDSGDFVLVSEETGPDQETVDSATAILDELEKRIFGCPDGGEPNARTGDPRI